MKRVIVSVFILVSMAICTNLKAEEVSPINKEIQPMTAWCTAMGSTTTTCPDGQSVFSGIIAVVFNCDTGIIFSITWNNYGNLPGLCEGHEGPPAIHYA